MDRLIPGIFSSALLISLATLITFLAIIVVALVSLLKIFFRRVCVLENHSVIESIRIGFKIVWENPKDIILMWLIVVGIQIGFAILMIPITLMMIIFAGISGGLFGLVGGGLTSIFSNGDKPIFVGVIIGVPIFLVLLITPLTFLTGLRDTYTSTVWTLSHREISLLESIKTVENEEPVEIMDKEDDIPLSE
jgi:hypothetical protein